MTRANMSNLVQTFIDPNSVNVEISSVQNTATSTQPKLHKLATLIGDKFWKVAEDSSASDTKCFNGIL